MNLYVYRIEDNKHVATFRSEDEEACFAAAAAQYDINDYAWTATPGFGAPDGIVEDDDADLILIGSRS